MSPEFQRLIQQAAVCLDSVGVLHAVIGAGVATQLGRWQGAVADLI